MLLVSPGDMAFRRSLIEMDIDGRRPDPNTVQHKWNLFLELMRWAEGGSCRHDAILRYFGDEEETLAGCGRCDVCTQTNQDDDSGDGEVSLIVRKALCGVARVHGKFGIQAAAKLLKGAEDERLNWSGLAKTPTFGTLDTYSEDWILTLLRRCVTAGWVDFHGGQRPVVVVTDDGKDVIHERRLVRMLLPPVKTARIKGTSSRGKGGGRKSASVDIDLDEQGRLIFEALRAWRVEMARKEKVPPYVISSDRTLREIAAMQPKTESDLTLAHGIGPAKVAKYGEVILDVLRSVS